MKVFSYDDEDDDKEPHMHAYDGHDADGVPNTAIGYLDVFGYEDNFPDDKERAKFVRQKFGKLAIVSDDDCHNNDSDSQDDCLFSRYPVFANDSDLQSWIKSRYE